MAVYLLAVPGGFIADRILGAKRIGSDRRNRDCSRSLCASWPSGVPAFAGLLLIAVGTGLFKPNISALVGALYAHDDVRRDAGFSLFTWASTSALSWRRWSPAFWRRARMFKGWLAVAGFDPALSWHWGFAAAGVGMTISMLFFARNVRAAQDPDLESDLRSHFAREGTYVTAGAVALLGLALLSDVEGFTWLRWLFLALAVAGHPLRIIAAEPGRAPNGCRRHLFRCRNDLLGALRTGRHNVHALRRHADAKPILGLPFPSAWYQSVNPIFVILLTPFAAWLWMRLGHGSRRRR